MSGSFEDGLRRAMELLGSAVESVIGKAKKAKMQVGTRSGVQPVLSLESQLPIGRIKDLIDASIQRVMAHAIPDIKNGMALEVGEGPVVFGSRMLSHQASRAIGVEIGGGSVGRQGDVSRGYIVRGSLFRLPFKDCEFSYALARFATTFQKDIARAIKEVGRVISRGGQGVIIDYHPYGLFATRGAELLRSVESRVRRFEDYYRICREAGMRVMEVREVFIDETTRDLFHEDEVPAYRSLKGTALITFLFVYKPKGKR